MNYVQATVNNKTYYLLKQPDDGWLYTQRIPPIDGELPMIITITLDNGKIIIGTDDVRLLSAITALTKDGNSVRGSVMLSYYPDAISCLLEYQALILATGFEIDFLKSEVNFVLNDAFLVTMGEERIKQWEIALGITPHHNSTIANRRDAVTARVRNGNKLNTQSISDLVKLFTEGYADSYFEDGCLHVLVSPPPNNKFYVFEDLELEIKKRIPAHLELQVKRNYSSWEDIRDNFISWDTLKTNLSDWENLKLYVVPRN